MTLVSDLITDAFRESNLISISATPTTNQQTEALNRLNSLVLSTVGFEAGDDLEDLNIGGTYDQSSLINSWLPDNIRLLLNLETAQTFLLDPYPYEGQRLAFVDAGNNLGVNNVTINGNGRNIEGASSLVLNTNGDTRQWMYRADTGDWIKITALVLTDEMPFPVEFDDYFITMLALRLNSRYSQEVAAETMKILARSKSLLQARYNPQREVESDIPYRYLSGNKRQTYTYSGDNFDKGRPYPYR